MKKLVILTVILLSFTSCQKTIDQFIGETEYLHVDRLDIDGYSCLLFGLQKVSIYEDSKGEMGGMYTYISADESDALELRLTDFRMVNDTLNFIIDATTQLKTLFPVFMTIHNDRKVIVFEKDNTPIVLNELLGDYLVFEDERLFALSSLVNHEDISSANIGLLKHQIDELEEEAKTLMKGSIYNSKIEKIGILKGQLDTYSK